MEFIFRIYLLIFAALGLTFTFVSPLAFSQGQQEEFIYDPQSRRDPFIPLLDPNSPTGLRTVFVTPEAEVKLPLEIAVQGILWNGREYFAIINGKVMKKGEYTTGVKIKEIKSDQVIVEYAAKEFTVFLMNKKKEKKQ